MMEKRCRAGESRAYYGKFYAWYDPDGDEGAKGTYKFPHHMMSMGGDPGDASTMACSSGIAALNGARGQRPNVPSGDRQGIYDHLAKHLRDAGKEPPEMKKQADSGSIEFTDRALRHEEMLAHVASEAWAILPTWLQAALSRPVAPHVAQDELLAITRRGPKSGRVARVPIIGPITKRDSLWSLFFGGTSVEGLKRILQEVVADDTIGTLLLDVDSPGGTAAGITELTAELRRVAESKHVVALANHLMTSAAYWIAAQADEIIATPDALVGSVGVFAVHADFSAMLERIGIKPTYISAGKYKTEANPDEPLSDEARDHIQSLVDEAYSLFVADVAQGRGITPAAVRSEYGEGRVLTARDAKAAGMIDRIAGADETIRRLAGAKAELAIDSPMAREHEADQARLAQLRRRLAIAEKL
jgi:signal peptide peptidase SppA